MSEPLKSQRPGRTRDETLPKLVAERAASDPERVWLEELEGRTVTYAQGHEEALHWAAAWRRVGVEAGDVVVTMQFNTADAVVGWLGLAWLGALENPINTDYRVDLLHHVLENTRAKVMLVRQEWLGRVHEIQDRLDHLEHLIVVDPTGDPLPAGRFRITLVDEFLAGVAPAGDVAPPRPSDIACVLYTSGTTGPSKGSLMPWGQLHSFPGMGLGPDEAILDWGPSYHLPAKVWPHMAALLGARVLMRPYLRLSTLADDCRRATFTQLLPPIIDAMLAQPPSPDDARCALRFWGGAASAYPGFEAFRARFGVRMVLLFGMTETGIAPLWAWDDEAPNVDAAGRPLCGRVQPHTYPHFECRLVDEHDQEVPPGTVGELIIRAGVPWAMTAGYLNMPEATLDTWRNGWFHTGDAMVADADGSFYFVDRMKDCIRRRGENISSVEVELAVRAHPAVLECAAVAARMPGGDEEIRIFVRRREAETLTAEELIGSLIGVMPRFMVPRFVDFVDAFPTTPTGKIRKVALRGAPLGDETWDREAAGITVPR